MKIILSSISIVVGLLLCLPVFAAENRKTERITGYAVEVKINRDSSINVREKIGYDFGDERRHGIFRDIPIEYKARGGNFKLRISNIFITDENGNLYAFSRSLDDNNISLKIGDEQQYVTGKKNYYINYKIKRAINYFADHDELYWNAIGTGWNVEIHNPSVQVIFPSDISATDVKKDCFVGVFGGVEKCDFQNYEQNNRSIFFTARTLKAGEGVTIVAGVPKGIIIKPTASQNTLDTLLDNWILFVPVMVFFIMFYLWLVKGRDPKSRRGTIIAQFDAPDNLTPSEIGVIIDGKARNEDISAEIINLAVKGYLKISRIEEKKLFGKKTDYLFEKLKDEKNLKNKFEITLFRSLFATDLELLSKFKSENEAGELIVQNAMHSHFVKLSSLQNNFYKKIEFITDEIYEAVTQKGYFRINPNKVRGFYIGLGIIIFGLIYGFSALLVWLGEFTIISAVASGLLIAIFGYVMPAKTLKGVSAKEHILGLKEYLSVAEKDRIDFHNAPEKNPEQFEKLLPYAMVLGVEKEWAKQFEGIYAIQPKWYADYNSKGFDAIFFANNLYGFAESANAILTSMPSSAAGGSSGFSGGGSGGGGGGGGGGSW